MKNKRYTTFDQIAFRTNFQGMEDLAEKTIRSFIAALPKMIELIQTSLYEKDPAALELAAHALKGALSNFYAEPARLLAWQMEQMGHGTINPDADKIFKNLVLELENLTADLQDFAEERMSA